MSLLRVKVRGWKLSLRTELVYSYQSIMVNGNPKGGTRKAKNLDIPMWSVDEKRSTREGYPKVLLGVRVCQWKLGV